MPSRAAAAGLGALVAASRAAPAAGAGAGDRGAPGPHPHRTPRTLRVRPPMLTRPPATARTDRTPCSWLIAVIWAEVAPAGTTAARSGTIRSRGGDPGGGPGGKVLPG